MDDAPRPLTALRSAFAARAAAAAAAVTDPPPDADPPRTENHRVGAANGWKAAHLTVQALMDLPAADDADSLVLVEEALEENKRRVMALSLANITHHKRAGTVVALDEAVHLVRAAITAAASAAAAGDAAAAQTPAPPAESNADALPHRTRPPVSPDAAEAPDGGEDLSDWSGYPRVPVTTVDSFHDLALFLGGDSSSFTGDLLRLIGKADPDNLNRLAAGFPRQVRAWLLWRASAPVTADILVNLLEATHRFGKWR